jgi:hypothetical protein
VVYAESTKLEIAAHQIGKYESAEIPNMAKVVDGRSTAIHSCFFAGKIERHKRFEGTRERIVEFQSHSAK